MAIGVLDRKRRGRVSADAAIPLDEHLELIGLVEMGRRHGAGGWITRKACGSPLSLTSLPST